MPSYPSTLCNNRYSNHRLEWQKPAEMLKALLVHSAFGDPLLLIAKQASHNLAQRVVIVLKVRKLTHALQPSTVNHR